MIETLESKISICMSDPAELTYSCRRGSISSSDVIHTDLMDSIGNVDHVGCINESGIHRPTPWRVICIKRRHVGALHTTRVDLRHLTSHSGGVELNCVGDLVAIHRLREMDLEWDRFRRSHTIVVPWEELGDDWPRSYNFIFWEERFEAPGSEAHLGKAAGERLSGIVIFQSNVSKSK